MVRCWCNWCTLDAFQQLLLAYFCGKKTNQHSLTTLRLIKRWLCNQHSRWKKLNWLAGIWIRSITLTKPPGGIETNCCETCPKNAVLIEKSVSTPQYSLAMRSAYEIEYSAGADTTAATTRSSWYFQDLSKERNNKVCHKHNMAVLDVVKKTLLHAFALFQELVKSPLMCDVEEYTTWTFVWSSTNHSQLLLTW